MTDYKLVPVEPTAEMVDLIKRLRIKAGMMELGEIIAWGSDSALMREAADVLERAGSAPDVHGEPVGSGWMLFPKAAWDFLCGTGELNGFGFGDRPMGQPPFWWRLVIRKMLDSAPQPTEQPECGCCGQTVKCDDDCDAVALRRAEQQPAACVGCEGAPGSDNSPCAVCGKQPAPDVAEEWSRAFLQIAVVLEALTSSDSDESLSRINAADVLGEAFGTLGRIRRVVSPDVSALVEALETALFGTPLDDVPNRDNDDIWSLCYQHLPEHASDALRDHLARIETALAAHRNQGGEV